MRSLLISIPTVRTGSLLLCIRLYHHVQFKRQTGEMCVHTDTYHYYYYYYIVILLCRTTSAYPLSELQDEYYFRAGGVISPLPLNDYTAISSFSNIIRDDDDNSDNNNCHRHVFAHSGVFFDNDRGGHMYIYRCIPTSSPISSPYSYCII